MNKVTIERNSSEYEAILEFQERFIQWFGIAGFVLMALGLIGAIAFGSERMLAMAIWSGALAFVGVAMLMLTPCWRTIAESD